MHWRNKVVHTWAMFIEMQKKQLYFWFILNEMQPVSYLQLLPQENRDAVKTNHFW